MMAVMSEKARKIITGPGGQWSDLHAFETLLFLQHVDHAVQRAVSSEDADAHAIFFPRLAQQLVHGVRVLPVDLAESRRPAETLGHLRRLLAVIPLFFAQRGI